MADPMLVTPYWYSAGQSITIQPHEGGPCCPCVVCESARRKPKTGKEVVSQLRARIEEVVSRIPSEKLECGSTSSLLDSALQELRTMTEAEFDPALRGALVMTTVAKARQVAAAGLYCPEARCQTTACHVLPCALRDGNLVRDMPSYCDVLERLVHLLGSKRLQVAKAAAFAIGHIALNTAGGPETGFSDGVAIRQRLVSLGATSKLLLMLCEDTPPEGASVRSKSSEAAAWASLQVQAAHALASLCEGHKRMERSVGDGLYKAVLDRPQAVRRAVAIAEMEEGEEGGRDGMMVSSFGGGAAKFGQGHKEQNKAMSLLVAVAGMGNRGAHLVRKEGGVRAAQAVVKALSGMPMEPGSSTEECLKHAVQLMATMTQASLHAATAAATKHASRSYAQTRTHADTATIYRRTSSPSHHRRTTSPPHSSGSFPASTTSHSYESERRSSTSSSSTKLSSSGRSSSGRSSSSRSASLKPRQAASWLGGLLDPDYQEAKVTAKSIKVEEVPLDHPPPSTAAPTPPPLATTKPRTPSTSTSTPPTRLQLELPPASDSGRVVTSSPSRSLRPSSPAGGSPSSRSTPSPGTAENRRLLESKSVRELKALLNELGISHQTLVEKREFVEEADAALLRRSKQVF